MEKKTLRRQVLAVRDGLSPEDIHVRSRAIKESLLSLKEYKESRTILFFLSFGTEVSTEAMVRESLSQGKRVIVPKSDKKTRTLILSRMEDYDADLAPGAYSIPEPRPEKLRLAEAREIDLAIVPGVAFDRRGNRLGYGGGYYDRFFLRLREKTPLVALAFSCQLVAEVPTEDFDWQVDCLITEEGVLRFGTGSAQRP